MNYVTPRPCCTAAEALVRRSLSILTEGLPAPVLRFPVVTHDEVLRILADKPPIEYPPEEDRR